MFGKGWPIKKKGDWWNLLSILFKVGQSHFFPCSYTSYQRIASEWQPVHHMHGRPQYAALFHELISYQSRPGVLNCLLCFAVAVIIKLRPVVIKLLLLRDPHCGPHCQQACSCFLSSSTSPERTLIDPTILRLAKNNSDEAFLRWILENSDVKCQWSTWWSS